MYLDLLSFFLGIISCFIIQNLCYYLFKEPYSKDAPNINTRNNITKETHLAEPVKYGEIRNEKQTKSMVPPPPLGGRQKAIISTRFSEDHREVGTPPSSGRISKTPPRPTTSVLSLPSHTALGKRLTPGIRGLQPHGFREKGDEKWELNRNLRKTKEIQSYTFPYAPVASSHSNIPKMEKLDTKEENYDSKFEENGEEGFQETEDIQPVPNIENTENYTDSTSEGEDEEEKEEKVKIMIEHIQKLDCPGIPPTRSEALKFLISKRFLMDQSVAVATAYADVWFKYGDIKISDIAPILRTGLIISPPNCLSKRNEQIMYIIPRNVDFSKDNPNDRVRTLLYYIQRDLKSQIVQKNGFLLVCDMEGAGLNPNIPSQKAMISLLQESIPAKARNILIVNGRMMFRGLIETTKLFLSNKIKNRVHVLKHVEQLLDYIDKENLLVSLGGTLEYYHLAYIEGELEKETVK